MSINDWPKHVQDQIRKQDEKRKRGGTFTEHQTLWIGKLPPGLNGDDGLINMHWTEYAKVKKKWVQYIFALQPKKHAGYVRVKYTRVSVSVMDWDNLGASFKVIGDALIENDVIEDDSPKVIKKFEIFWKKAVSYRDQGVKIEIESI